jgi:hypothetical protein
MFSAAPLDENITHNMVTRKVITTPVYHRDDADYGHADVIVDRQRLGFRARAGWVAASRWIATMESL